MPTEKTEGRVVYVCPEESCAFFAMTPGKCRSHPYPCRAMGPALVPIRHYSEEEIREKLLSEEAIRLGAYAGYGWLNPSTRKTQEDVEERETYLEPFKAGVEITLAAAFQDHDQEN